jgi:multidrug efflux pump subunit AcrA (membrane-fusion protein)
MARKQQPHEPLASIAVKGMVHHVPQSLAVLETAIAQAVELQAEVNDLNAKYEARGAETQRLIAAHEAEIRKLNEALVLERAPVKSLLDSKTAQLEQAKIEVADAARPLMGDQRSLKYQGVAGPVLIERTPKMTVVKGQVATLRQLLADKFTEYFEVEEKVKPLRKAWELLVGLKGRKLAQFKEAVEIEDPIRVRVLEPGK